MFDKQLLDKFLRNECSAAERRLVLEYLEDHPDEAADLLPEREFAEIEPEMWDAERSDRSFGEVRQRLRQRTRPMIRWSLVAASVLIVAVGIRWITLENTRSG